MIRSLISPWTDPGDVIDVKLIRALVHVEADESQRNRNKGETQEDEESIRVWNVDCHWMDALKNSHWEACWINNSIYAMHPSVQCKKGAFFAEQDQHLIYWLWKCVRDILKLNLANLLFVPLGTLVNFPQYSKNTGNQIIKSYVASDTR